MRRVVALGLVLLGLGLLGVGVARGQGALPPVRLALLQQWVLNQHRDALPRLRTAVDEGVVDRRVFAWQRGVLQREALVVKPVRVLPAREAAPLGGRGDFQLVDVRPPSGKAAWTEVDVVGTRTAAEDDVLVLEVGGELNVLGQVLAAILVLGSEGALRPFGVERTALVPGPGVAAVQAYFGRPVAPPDVALRDLPGRFRDLGGVSALVARSRIGYVANGAVTPNGLADVSPLGDGSGADWREGDRVLLRVPLALLRAGIPALVLVWKDRRLAPDPEAEFPRRSSLAVPFGG